MGLKSHKPQSQPRKSKTLSPTPWQPKSNNLRIKILQWPRTTLHWLKNSFRPIGRCLRYGRIFVHQTSLKAKPILGPINPESLDSKHKKHKSCGTRHTTFEVWLPTCLQPYFLNPPVLQRHLKAGYKPWKHCNTVKPSYRLNPRSYALKLSCWVHKPISPKVYTFFVW